MVDKIFTKDILIINLLNEFLKWLKVRIHLHAYGEHVYYNMCKQASLFNISLQVYQEHILININEK